MHKFLAIFSLLLLVLFSCTAPVSDSVQTVTVQTVTVQTVTMTKMGAGELTTDISASFTDPNFKQSVWEWLGNTGTPGSFTKQDLIDQLAVSSNRLFATQNNITSLAGLEHFEGTGITFINVGWNQITELPPLPSTLEVLYCYYNELTTLPELPAGLRELSCDNNNLITLPALPATLTKLNCSQNQLASIPALPAGLTNFSCGYNPLVAGLPELPDTITEMTASNCNLTELPELPANLRYFTCGWNPDLETIPALPNGIVHLYLTENGLTSLPALPEHLLILDASRNKLTDIPTITPEVYRFYFLENYMNAFSGPVKDKIDNNNATQKFYQPQYRYTTNSVIELSPAMVKEIVGGDLLRERTYDGVEWFDDATGDPSEFTFSTSDAAVATVDADGVITAVDNGSCTITANFSGIQAEYTTITFTVTVSPLIPLWTPGTYYYVGDQVTHNSEVYECTYDNFAQFGWEPDKPELWAVWKKI